MTNGGGRVVGYTYDLAGNVITLTYPGPKSVTRGFDDASRLTSVTDWLATPTTSTFGYDQDSDWTSTSYGNTDTATRTYNNADQLTALAYKKGATNLGTLTYTRTNASLLATTTPSAGAPGTTDTYTYNARAELTSRDNSGTAWAYDNADRITKLTSGTTLAYDNADQITTANPSTGPTTTYTYDNRGNRTTALVTGAGSSTTDSYDQAGNVTSFTPAGGSPSVYGYDGDGLRASKTPAGGTKQYLAWDVVSGSVPLQLSDYVQNFLYGPGGQPVEQIKGANATYVMADQLGSTIMLTGATGAVTGTWAYDVYGNITMHTGTGSIPLLYASEYQDGESGLYYLRNRYYDPGTARMLSVDAALFSSGARYMYAAGSPVNATDPTGLMCWNVTDLSCVGHLASDVWRPVRATATLPITQAALTYDAGKSLVTGQSTNCSFDRNSWVFICYGGDTILNASATTFGGLVNTSLTPTQFASANCGGLLAHETKHTDQWALFGPGFALLDGLDATQGQIRATLSGKGKAGNYQLFENWAGLSGGGYVPSSCGCQ